MAKYLDPKADLTFKKVFGEHKNLVISLLNALLPLDEGKKVESIEYLPSERVPRTPLSKDTSVDVRCEETGGRKFIVEMQMNWTANFKQRVLLNASKAYVMQLPKGEDFQFLQPVYSLNLVNATYNDAEMHEYDRFWDRASREATFWGNYKRAVEERDAAREKLLQTVRNLKAMNLTVGQIVQATGLTAAEIANC